MTSRDICNLTHNIFTTNYRLKVIISSNLNSKLKLLFYSSITTNNNLSLRICCKNVIDVTFLINKYIYIVTNVS